MNLSLNSQSWFFSLKLMLFHVLNDGGSALVNIDVCVLLFVLNVCVCVLLFVLIVGCSRRLPLEAGVGGWKLVATARHNFTGSNYFSLLKVCIFTAVMHRLFVAVENYIFSWTKICYGRKLSILFLAF